MNFKKTKVAVASGLMAASMVLAPLAAYADTFGPANPAMSSASIVKTVNVADGTTIAGNVIFQLKQINEPSATMADVTAPNETTSGFAEINGIKNGTTDYTYDESTRVYKVEAKTDGKTNASDKEVAANDDDTTYIESVGLDFSQAYVEGKNRLDNGLYTFELTEVENSAAKYQNHGDDDVNKPYGWSGIDKTVYYLRVYVTSRGIEYTIAKKNDDNTTTKVEKADFNDTYTARANSKKEDGNPSTDASLVINKTVADKTYLVNGTKFNFTVNFTGVTGLVNVPTTLHAVIYKTGTNTRVGGEKTLTVTEGKVTFSLEDGQEIRFADIPAGVKYTVTEGDFANDGGTKNITTASNLTGWKSGKTTETAVLSDKVANGTGYENTLKTITITGVVTHSAPFVIMVGALFVAVGGYVVLKKRIEE